MNLDTHTGLCPNLSNEDYHAANALSKSRLDEFLITPRHYWLRYGQPASLQRKEKQHFIIGSASHCAVLEPELFESRYVAIPDDAPKKPTAAQLKAKSPSDAAKEAIYFWQQFDAENAGKIALPREDYQDILIYRDCALGDPLIRSLLSKGMAEQSFFATDEDTGLRIKCRPDYLRLEENCYIDLKFVRDASRDGFGRACANHNYDVQSYFYPHVMQNAYGTDSNQAEFFFIAIEKGEFGAVAGVYFADKDMIESGRKKTIDALVRLSVCQHTNNWPSYTQESQPVKFKFWN